MRFDLDTSSATYNIKGYEDGAVTVNEKTYQHSLIISPEKLITSWPISSISEFSEEDCKKLLTLNPELVLLGTGHELCFPAIKLIVPFQQHGIGFEAMTTQAACRTYNVLVAEGRKVVAGLILS